MTLTDPAPAVPDAPVATDGGTRTRARARRGEGDRLRAEILDAAEALLVERTDPEAVSIRSITARVGCTAPSLYRHFADKDALLLEVCEKAFEHFDDYIQSRMPIGADPIEGLVACARAYIDFAIDHPGHYRILFMTPDLGDFDLNADGTIDFSDKGAVTLQRLVEQVQGAMDAGMVQGSSATSVASLLWAVVHGFASLRITKAGFPWPPLDRQFDELTGLLVHGLCPFGGRGPATGPTPDPQHA